MEAAGRTGDVLDRMVAAVEPASAAADDIAWMGAEPEPVQVFDHDVYTVLLAADPTAIPAALRRVPPKRRPTSPRTSCASTPTTSPSTPSPCAASTTPTHSAPSPCCCGTRPSTPTS